jgi:hypothetical protein
MHVLGNKAWNGLVKGYYDKRYQLYAKHKLASIVSRGKMREDSSSNISNSSNSRMTSSTLTAKALDAYHSDVMQLACEFGHTTGATLPVEPVGDAVEIAKQMHSKYAPKDQ